MTEYFWWVAALLLVGGGGLMLVLSARMGALDADEPRDEPPAIR